MYVHIYSYRYTPMSYVAKPDMHILFCFRTSHGTSLRPWLCGDLIPPGQATTSHGFSHPTIFSEWNMTSYDQIIVFHCVS